MFQDGIDITDDLGSYTAHYTPLRPERNAEGNLPNNVKSTDPKLLGALHVIVAGKVRLLYFLHEFLLDKGLPS